VKTLLSSVSPRLRRKSATAAFIWLTVLLWGLLTLLAGMSTPSSLLAYLVFSVIFLGLLVTGIAQRESYGYFFLSLFIWLGFWFKYTLHILIDYPFVEPVGNFFGAGFGWYRSELISPVSYSIGEKLAWDEVLLASSCGAAGVVLAFCIYWYSTKRNLRSPNPYSVPSWYTKVRTKLWLAVLLSATVAAIANSVLGIQQIGLVSRVLLPWPMNALLSWWVSIGAAITVGTLVYWDMKIGKNLVWPVCSILFEGLLSTVSLLSRGTYIFHSLPQLLALCGHYREIVGIKGRQLGFLIPVGIVLLLFSIVAVTALRTQLYSRGGSNVIQADVSSKSVSSLPNTSEKTSWQLHILDEVITEMRQRIASGQAMRKQLAILIDKQTMLERELLDMPIATPSLKSDFIDSLRSVVRNVVLLSSDRWIGLEGVMAVQTYEGKNLHTFLKALTERREVGQLTSYQFVSNSPYAAMSSNQNQFAALPGSIAFLLLSGSLWFVIGGMLILSLALLFFERLVLRLTSNPLICALIGLAMANTIAQMGVAPKQDIPYYLMISMAVFFIYFIQSQRLVGLLVKIKI